MKLSALPMEQQRWKLHVLTLAIAQDERALKHDDDRPRDRGPAMRCRARRTDQDEPV
jgi:hypothetical protein